MHFRQNLHLEGKSPTMKALLLALSAFFAIASFSPDQIEGRWSRVYNDGNEVVYARVAKDAQGSWFDFAENGQLSVRQNAGWCGTPPISYTTYTGGSYELTKKGKLTMIHEFWGGMDTTYHQIASVTDDTLRMKFMARGSK